jgi:hypothetical protein
MRSPANKLVNVMFTGSVMTVDLDPPTECDEPVRLIVHRLLFTMLEPIYGKM